MLLPVMLLASGCQNRHLQPVLIEPEEWYRGMISDDQKELEDARKRACFLNVANDVIAEIREPRDKIELIEVLPTAMRDGGWTPKKVRLVVSGQDVFIDRHETEPYMKYSDSVDKMLGIDPGDEARSIRSGQPYCFNITLRSNNSPGDN